VIYVGIDPGRRTGWAALDEDGKRIASGYWHFKGKGWARRFAGRVDELLRGLNVTKVGFEHVTFHKGKAWAEIYYGQKALLFAAVKSSDPPPVLVTPGKVKATGGSRVKIGLMSNALERWNLGEDYPIDDNEADALWIAETVRLMDGQE
jgi:Holliday junction resolvasome RuvABC endonuclease subunit